MKTKLLFNTVLFFAAGIISIVRAEAVELVISAVFSILFLSLWIGSQKSKTIIQ